MSRSRSSGQVGAPRARRWAAALLASASVFACSGDGGRLTDPPDPVVGELLAVSGSGQTILSGRRSPEAFRVQARSAGGDRLEGVEISFRVEGLGGGILSQPVALTDAHGMAETFLLNTLSGAGRVVAEAGTAAVELPFDVQRAPGEIRWEAATGARGLPGFPHPDSVLKVRVFDTEGRPLPGQIVWFSAPGDLSQYNDTTDAEGWAETRLRKTELWAGPGSVFAFILGFPEVTARSERPLVAAARKVVLIAVDGLRWDAIDRYAPPTLSMLATDGASTDDARTVLPSLTVPAHLSLLAGVPPDEHGVLGDRVRFTPEMAALQPLFRFARDNGASGAAFMSDRGPLSGFREALQCKQAFGLDSLTLVESTGSAVVDAAAGILANPSVGLVFLHIPDPDIAGHLYGWSSPQYGQAVLDADDAVARIIAENGGGDGSTLFVVVSDHGGGGSYGDFLHGSDAEPDRRIPLVLWGAGARPVNLGKRSILDVAPTVLWALGMRPPPGYRGEILFDAFR